MTKDFILSTYSNVDLSKQKDSSSNGSSSGSSSPKTTEPPQPVSRAKKLARQLSTLQNMLLTQQQRSEIKANLVRFDFRVWGFGIEEMIIHITVMFDTLGLIEEYEINPVTLATFLRALQRSYYENPYHNFHHAFDVTQMCFLALTTNRVREFMRKQEMLVLLVSAICHDVNHPGLNNTYQVNARTELAVQYNDISVLENHHCSMTFNILNDEKNSKKYDRDRDYIGYTMTFVVVLRIAALQQKPLYIQYNLK
jgi:high affinity cGMP-specific 3',5'-cyclic phosphodiesterase 9